MFTFIQRKSILSVFTGVIMFTSVPVIASSDKSSQSSGDTILTQYENDPLRKRMPSRNFLEVIYLDGFITIDSYYYEGEFSLSLENCESGECYEVSSIQVGESVPLTLPCGEYQVKAVGMAGIVLSGYMEIF